MVPVPTFVARVLETEMADRDGEALVFESARGGGYLTLGPGPLHIHQGGGGGRRDRRGAAARSSPHLRVPGDQRGSEREGGAEAARPQDSGADLDRYGHLFPDDLDAVAAAFDSAADQLRTAAVPKPVAAARK